MRIFSIKSWEYAVKSFDLISKQKKYAVRYRLEYYQFVFGKSKLKNRISGAFNFILGYFSEIRYLLLYQFFNSTTLPKDALIVIHISNSNSFLKTIIPISEMLLKSGQNPIFLCPANHYEVLKKRPVSTYQRPFISPAIYQVL